MKRTLLLACLIPAIVFIACKKEKIIIDNHVKDSFLDSAIQYLKSNLSENDFSKLNVTSAQILAYQNKTIGVKFFEKGNTTNDKYILLNKQENFFTGNYVTISGIETLISEEHNGTIKLEALDKTESVEYVIENNKATKITRDDKDAEKKILLLNSQTNLTDINRLNNTNLTARAVYVLPEVVITVYLEDDRYDYWSLSYLDMDGGYNGLYSPGSGLDASYSYGGGGGSNSSNTADNVIAAPTFSSPEKPVLDIKKEIECFTNNSTATYKITVNINQPEPNTREIVNAFSDYPVGHTYLTLEQQNFDGSSVIRNIGFYPKDFVKPGDAIDESVFGDDSNTPFDVSLKISVSGSDFMRVINSLANQQIKSYNLNSFNCTNSSIEALNSINIYLPSTRSKDLLFQGNSPADLGEDIRNMDLNNFSAVNGYRQVIRTVSNYNNRTPASKKGTC